MFVVFALSTGVSLAGAAAASAGAAGAAVQPAGDANAQARVAEAAEASTIAGSTLDGIWMFDAKRSDDPQKVMESARQQGGPGGMGMRGGPGGGPPGGGMRGGMRGGPRGGDEGEGEARDGAEGASRGPGAFERVLRPARKVVIEMLADQVNVAEDERSPRPYAIEDSLAAHRHDLLTPNTKARWKSGRLVMTQSLGQRGSLAETYELSRDGKTLTIRARREGGPSGMPNPTFTRVYTRYEGD